MWLVDWVESGERGRALVEGIRPYMGGPSRDWASWEGTAASFVAGLTFPFPLPLVGESFRSEGKSSL